MECQITERIIKGVSFVDMSSERASVGCELVILFPLGPFLPKSIVSPRSGIWVQKMVAYLVFSPFGSGEFVWGVWKYTTLFLFLCSGEGTVIGTENWSGDANGR